MESIERTFNREGSLYLGFNEKNAFLMLNNERKRYKVGSCQKMCECSPLSFEQYIYKIWFEII